MSRAQQDPELFQAAGKSWGVQGGCWGLFSTKQLPQNVSELSADTNPPGTPCPARYLYPQSSPQQLSTKPCSFLKGELGNTRMLGANARRRDLQENSTSSFCTQAGVTASHLPPKKRFLHKLFLGTPGTNPPQAQGRNGRVAFGKSCTPK